MASPKRLSLTIAEENNEVKVLLELDGKLSLDFIHKAAGSVRVKGYPRQLACEEGMQTLIDNWAEDYEGGELELLQVFIRQQERELSQLVRNIRSTMRKLAVTSASQAAAKRRLKQAIQEVANARGIKLKPNRHTNET
jgi:hypothetical protein